MTDAHALASDTAPSTHPESAADGSEATGAELTEPCARPEPPAPITDLPLPPEAVRRSLRASMKDGVAASVMVGFGGSYIVPFVILSGSGLFRLAALSALPGVAAAVVQCFAAEITDAVRRRRLIIVLSVVAQAVALIPVCIAIFLTSDARYWVMLTAYVLYSVVQNFGIPAWQSLMGDLVPPHRRGSYFGLRNALCSAVATLTFVAAGWWLVLCGESNAFRLLGLAGRDFGFLVLFALACIARFISAWYVSRMHDAPYTPQPSDHFTLLDFVRRAPRAHFGRFVFYLTLIHIGYGFMGPFYGWYLLDRDQLGLSTRAFANIMAVGMVMTVVMQPVWGRVADRIGNKRVMTICGIGAILFPVFLLLCRNPYHFAAVQFYDGVTTAGFAIATSNYIFDVVSPPKRARCTAFYTLFITVGILIGAFPGAFVATHVHVPLSLGPLTITHVFTLLLIGSAVFRLLANVLLLGSFQEFRLSRPVFVPEDAKAA